MPMSCASRNHIKVSKDPANLFLATAATFQLTPDTSTQHLPGSRSPPDTPQLPRGMQGTSVPPRGTRACFCPLSVPPLPCTGCVGLLQCQLSGLWGWGGGAACRASVSLPPYCHFPLCSWQSCEGEGKARGMFGLLFLWALYNFKGFPLVHRGQGAEVSRHGLTSLSPPPQKGEMHTHTQRKKKRKMRSWQTLLSSNLSSP